MLRLIVTGILLLPVLGCVSKWEHERFKILSENNDKMLEIKNQGTYYRMNKLEGRIQKLETQKELNAE